MLIFGRSPNLVLGALLAVYGVVGSFHVFGFAPTADQTGQVVIAFGAIVALIANTSAVQIAAGKAATARAAK